MTDHDWQTRKLSGEVVPGPGEYDVDVTDGQWGTLCRCAACGLRALSSEAIDIDEVEGLPACCPITVTFAAAPGVEPHDLARLDVQAELERIRIATSQKAQHRAERLFLAAEVASLALGLPPGSALASEVAVGISQLSTAAARAIEISAAQVEWDERQRRKLAMSLLLLEWWMANFVAADDFNWGPADDDDEEAWKEWDDRLHPDNMLARVRELRGRAERTACVAEVMEE